MATAKQEAGSTRLMAVVAATLLTGVLLLWLDTCRRETVHQGTPGPAAGSVGGAAVAGR